MQGLIIEYLAVFALLQLFFGYFEYQYRPDIFYIVGRLLTAPKYIVPSLVLPLVFTIMHRIVLFLS